jgi:phosphohistidine phosphatase
MNASLRRVNAEIPVAHLQRDAPRPGPGPSCDDAIVADRTERLELYLLRHADAGDSGAWIRPDAERPLSEKGLRQARRMARYLAALGLEPDAILTSPKIRAAQSAAAVGEALDRPVIEDPRLASVLDVRTLEEILHAAGDPRRPILVGHDPDFSDLLATLVGAPAVPMRKGALARVDLTLPIEPGAGVLRWLIPPEALAD